MIHKQEVGELSSDLNQDVVLLSLVFYVYSVIQINILLTLQYIFYFIYFFIDLILSFKQGSHIE